MQNQKFRCSICLKEYPEEEITYKEEDIKKVNPICHDCLNELFTGDRQLSE